MMYLVAVSAKLQTVGSIVANFYLFKEKDVKYVQG